MSSKASTLSSNTRVHLEQSSDRQFVLEQHNFELQATITVLRERILELEAEKRGLEIAQDVLQYVVHSFASFAPSLRLNLQEKHHRCFFSIGVVIHFAPLPTTFAFQHPHHNTGGPAPQVHEDAGIAT